MAQNLCGYSQEEITKMLCAIQDICEENCCNECPLGTRDKCYIRDGGCPSNWNLGLPKVWRAFS